MEQIYEIARKRVTRIFPTNPDLADLLGDTDFDFESFYFLDFLDPNFPDFQVPDFQKSGLGQVSISLHLRIAFKRSSLRSGLTT